MGTLADDLTDIAARHVRCGVAVLLETLDTDDPVVRIYLANAAGLGDDLGSAVATFAAQDAWKDANHRNRACLIHVVHEGDSPDPMTVYVDALNIAGSADWL